MKIILLIWSLLMVFFSYEFVDPNFPLPLWERYFFWLRTDGTLTALLFSILIIGFFILYFYFLKKANQMTPRQVWLLIFLVSLILFFAWPAFSYDIFNYIATAKVAFYYQENPYLVMPIEFTGDPLLKFMHQANRVAPYGPFWIILAGIPHFLGGNKIVPTLFLFKALTMAFYFGSGWLVYKITKSLFGLVFFSLNPLVLIETLVSAHNDVIMLFWALLAVYCLFDKKKILSLIFLLLSVAVKWVTFILLPLFFLINKFKKDFWLLLATAALVGAFFLLPLFRELYSWYFIWVIGFTSLLPDRRWLAWLGGAFSFGLLLRYLPYLYWRTYAGPTPIIKTIVTFLPPALVIGGLIFARTKVILKEPN